MPVQKNYWRLGVLVSSGIALGIGILVSLFVFKKNEVDLSRFHGTLLEKPRAINQFLLDRTDDQAFNNESLKNHWTMVFFGFSNCGYLCPTTLAELAKMVRILEKKKVKTLPSIVMITIDPDRDSLDRLKQYIRAFNPNFYAARGDYNIINSMTREMGISYTKIMLSRGGPGDYDVQHSGAIMLFNPQGELNAFFTTPHQGELLAEDYQLLQG